MNRSIPLKFIWKTRITAVTEYALTVIISVYNFAMCVELYASFLVTEWARTLLNTSNAKVTGFVTN